ncbi:hypothetical protein [Caviibacterium pharyngocola]|uniref:Outer membrane protein n=1 Tax=Caviibacterium pharyngocola TaxID=28159 RepID=A0A2M8RT19_9PAST|nr:hypothetical protein [Caviibacterium pharyngocola]PJG82030.1 hypothetical protein CVP04_11095 [Caviibacterium pharyngocola]
MKQRSYLLLPAAILSVFPTALFAQEEPNWVDSQHHSIRTTLHDWANSLDGWIGDTDPNRPASAGLRIMLDSEWNRYDRFSIKPRIRGKIKLPALKNKVSLVFGDDELDNESRDKNRIGSTYAVPLEKNKRYDRKQAREDNASLALRWSETTKRLGIKTDIDVGVRAVNDIYLRFRAAKEWQLTENIRTRLEQIYRYGAKSKHYLRTNFENNYAQNDQTFIANHLHLQYTNDFDEERTSWGNSFYRQHDFAEYKRLNYGIYIGGNVKNKRFDLNQYGPFITWRQPILRRWLFIQPELHYYNDKAQDRIHHLGAFLRLEAIF